MFINQNWIKKKESCAMVKSFLKEDIISHECSVPEGVELTIKKCLVSMEQNWFCPCFIAIFMPRRSDRKGKEAGMNFRIIRLKTIAQEK